MREADGIWIQYKNGSKYNEMYEIKSYHEETGGFVVILKKTNGFMFKLTFDNCYFGFHEDSLNKLLYSGVWNFDVLKWQSRDKLDHYYVTEAPEKWSEYLNGSMSGEFIEIERSLENGLVSVIVLKSFCGDLIKLTNEMCYKVVGLNENKIEAGSWTSNRTNENVNLNNEKSKI